MKNLIMEKTEKSIIDLRKRFVSEYKLPIPVFDSETWDFFLELYQEDYQAKDKWNNLIEGIKSDYNGSHGNFLVDFYSVREAMIKSLSENPKFQDYSGNTKGLSEERDINGGYYEVPEKYRSVRKDSIYNEFFVGGQYLSIDLRKANFQAMNYYDSSFFTGQKVGEGGIDEVYLGWLDKFKKETYLDEYIKASKYIREVVFGNLNPKRQIKIEKYLVIKVLDYLESSGIIKTPEIVQLGSDEVVIKTETRIADDTIKDILANTGIDVKMEQFKLEVKKFIKPGGGNLSIFRKRPIDSSSERGTLGEYKGIPRLYAAQIVEWLNGYPVDEENRDLMFYMEGDPAMFLRRLVENN